MDTPLRTKHCTIVPPYLLEAIARNASGAPAERARQAIGHDDRWRTLRGSGVVSRRTVATSATPPTGAPAPQRTISDAHQTQTLPGDPVRTEGAPASADVAVNQAYDGLGDTWDLYWDVYQRNSLDGQGGPLLATVHYGQDYDNAFWDGTQMVFGDGDGEIFGGFTRSVDVIGHELTHAVTEHTAGLDYSGQPGALNESISDAFGSCVKQHALGQTAEQADWLIGADLLAPGVQGRALRDMAHPGTAYDDPRLGKDPQPADMAHYVDTTDDNGGVHINSGIPNRAFVLAAQGIGGDSWSGAGQVWYDVLTGSDITAECDFATFADLTVAAAGARFGADGPQQQAVRGAWVTAGVLTGAPGDGSGDGSNDASGDPGSAGQPSEPPPNAATQVRLARSGGFAGIGPERAVRLGELPHEDEVQWRSLLGGRELHELVTTGSTPGADRFAYRVSCPECEVDLELSEAVLPGQVLGLFQRTLRR